MSKPDQVDWWFQLDIMLRIFGFQRRCLFTRNEHNKIRTTLSLKSWQVKGVFGKNGALCIFITVWVKILKIWAKPIQCVLFTSAKAHNNPWSTYGFACGFETANVVWKNVYTNTVNPDASHRWSTRKLGIIEKDCIEIKLVTLVTHLSVCLSLRDSKTSENLYASLFGTGKAS